MEKTQKRRLKLQISQVDDNDNFEKALLAASDHCAQNYDSNGKKRSKTGMEFLEARKEISRDNKKKFKGDATWNAAQKQSLSKEKTQISLPQNPTPGQKTVKLDSKLSLIKAENMLGKREKIRKFMKDKAKLIS